MRLKDIDLNNLDLYEKGLPHEMFEVLRKESPVYWQEEEDGQGYWAITKYDDVVAVSKNTKLFSSQKGAVYLEEMSQSQMEVRRSMLETDPPLHTKLRGLLSKDFTPKSVKQYEEFIRNLAKKLLEEAFSRESFNFVHDVAGNLTMGVVAEMMGIPGEDMPELIHWTNQMIGSTDDDEERLVDRDDQSLKDLPMRSPTSLKVYEYAKKVADEKRLDPQQDIITKLVEGSIDGRPLTEQEYRMYFILLLIAGNETNRSTMSHGIVALKEHPLALEKLQNDFSLLPTAIEEILRWATPVYYFRRTTTKDTEIRGVKIEEGAKVVMWYNSANFDEEIFSDPYTFNIGREKNRHLVFGGGGPHFCLGAPLARMEIRILYEELLPHFDRLHIAQPISLMRSNHFHSLKELILSYK
ncbi:cytochrome P450 [Candidatus Uabimicrobium amorphum]|uniref:Methyl-branched lipid omega-hydroxylase n=1 Tax=Uabimicrobium amorphum TaxID=2596890 RepID=A0A5S9IIJ0_UABAM|nr:cytochrome P450 [Candidatus Uabimicrobium amorphum]BBM82217.1 methyl-branched lipid omega-hydroxylase [Candidatus Uabimicrobium amorphum]